MARAALPRLEDYFGLPYAFGKLDQVGLPEFEAGAMENAGLITYREVALLLDPATASLAQRKRVAEVVTHELAHQWFGNLVTMTWWDDLWLNEAFATWIAYLVVDDWRPDWRVWLEFDQGKASALALDALRSTHPVHAPVRTVAEATEAFDLITYEKGGAVLRMLEGYLGRERFRDGIRLYMRRHARGNAVAADLWRALGEASGEPVLELAEAWIDAPGFPVVSASLDGATLRLSQRRFFSRPGDAEAGARWPVPLVLRYAAGGQVRERRLVLREATATVTLEGPPDWLVANAGATGFYRVALDAALRRAAGRPPRPAGAGRAGGAAGRRVGPGPLRRAAGGGLAGRWRWPSRGRPTTPCSTSWWRGSAAIDHRLVEDADRPRAGGPGARAVRRRLPGGRLGRRRPGRATSTGCGGPRCCGRWGCVGRDEAAVAEATARLERFAGGDRAALEPNLVDAGGDHGGARRRRGVLRALPGPLRAGGRAGLAAPLAAGAGGLRGAGAGGAVPGAPLRRRRAAAGLGLLRDHAAVQPGGAAARPGPGCGPSGRR